MKMEMRGDAVGIGGECSAEFNLDSMQSGLLL